MKSKEIKFWAEEAKNIAGWMKNYVDEAGAKGFVIGISGGIDSSIAATLAVEAVGKENVVGVIMPCYSNSQDQKDGDSFAKGLGIRYEYKGLSHIYDVMSSYCGELDNIRSGNIKARLRMIMLYDMAAKHNYLVLGTGNLSELLVGYTTKFGDGGVDIEPLGNYYKTELYKMAEAINSEMGNPIPQHIIKKKPSAGLWDGQTDEDEIGMSYKKLDKILEWMNEKCNEEVNSLINSIKEIQKTYGFSKEELTKVMNLIAKATHKNNPPPRVLK